MSKTDQAYVALRQDIVGGALRPDQPLTISSLQARYGLGWTPLRDALSRLAQGVLPGARADEALSAILYRTSSIEHHTILMDTALDRDETRALGLLREHIGLPADSRARAGADGGPTGGSMRDDARVRAR